jgi:hypothetical protein
VHFLTRGPCTCIRCLLASRLWLAKFDVDVETAGIASETWAECSRGMPPAEAVPLELLPLLPHKEEHVRCAHTCGLVEVLSLECPRALCTCWHVVLCRGTHS